MSDSTVKAVIYKNVYLKRNGKVKLGGGDHETIQLAYAKIFSVSATYVKTIKVTI